MDITLKKRQQRRSGVIHRDITVIIYPGQLSETVEDSCDSAKKGEGDDIYRTKERGTCSIE